ncbi:MAG: hypothetical protein HY331_04795 [Chloroflexi bacterium]|nr:hypothetical protein [Chloroflexota bacterium]
MGLPLIDATRRNHALEHATINVLIQQLGNLRVMGRSTTSGFYIYGNIATEAIEQAVAEGFRRLRAGEAELAISPQCGTNLAVAGILAGLCSMVAMGSQRRADRIGSVILAATGAIIASQPIGRLAQRYVTTCAELHGLRVRRVLRLKDGPLPIHKVETVDG